MNKKLFIIVLLTFSGACTKKDYPINENIVSNQKEIPFREISLLVSIKTSDTTWLAVEKVDSVKLFINNSYWNTVSSDKKDTSKLKRFPANNLWVNYDKLNYLVVAGQVSQELVTAGDYSTYMNFTNELPPGDYVCLIESFQLVSVDGYFTAHYPYAYTVFSVLENTHSAFVGEVIINL